MERSGINTGTNKLLHLTYDKHNTQFNIYENVDGSLFHDIFEISRKYLKNGELVDLHEIETTEDGIGYNDCYNYLSEDGLSGFSITPDGDLISVFNASGKGGFLGAIAPIVKERAKTLDCYNSPNQPLKGMYEKIFGFKTASVMEYNMDFDHDNIAENHNKPQIAFMVNSENDVETKSFTKDEYDEAVAYRDSFITKATSDNEAASFMPENSAEESFEGVEDTDAPQQSETQQSEDEESLEDEEETDFLLTEPDISEEKVDWVQSYADGIVGHDRKTAGQTMLIKAAQKLGWKIGFSNVYKKDKNGRIIRDENGRPKRAEARVNKAKKEIVFDYQCPKPIKVLIKHELTHFLENDEGGFFHFVNDVIKSNTFKNWIRLTPYKTVEEYKKAIIKEYKGASGFENATDAQRSADCEMVANFVADKLFKKEQKMLNRLVEELTPTQRSKLGELIHKLLAKLKYAFAGMQQEKEIRQLEKKWIETYKKAEAAWQEKQQKENTTQESGEQYAINELNITESDIEENIKSIITMDVVSKLSGEEFAKGEKDLVSQVDDYFATMDYSVENSILGDVDVTARGAKDSIAHGLGRNKAIAFAAVPNIIKDGKIIDYQKNWKNRGYDTVVLAAPIKIGEKPFYAGVIVIRDSKTQRFYVHEVITEERTDIPFKTGADKKVEYSGGISSPSIVSLLDKIRVVKENLTIHKVDNTNSTQNSEEYSISLLDKEIEDTVSQTKKKKSVDTTSAWFDLYDSGEITREELVANITQAKKKAKENPKTIADSSEDDANTTPPLKRREGESKGDKKSKFYSSVQKSDIFDEEFKAEAKLDSL